MLMRRLSSIQSKYVGPNQNSVLQRLKLLTSHQRCHFKRKEKWSQPMATRISQSHGRKKRSTETWQIHLCSGPMAERRSVHRVSIGTRLDCKCLDYISEIVISHNAPCRQRLRKNNTVYMRAVDSKKQAGPLCQRHDQKSSANALSCQPSTNSRQRSTSHFNKVANKTK